jgi:hypothetical protein
MNKAMGSKILFLDFDDVLNTAATLERGELFESANVDVLNAVVDRTNAVIVVTSMWRLGATVPELEELLVDAGVHATGRVVGATPCLVDQPRVAEIAAWLKQTRHPVKQFVILDNLCDMGHFEACLVQTDPQCGLVWGQVEEIVRRLERGPASGASCCYQRGEGTFLAQEGFSPAAA